MRILLTGFCPFGEHEQNPTELLMEAIESRKGNWPSLNIKTLVIETAYSACKEQVEEALRAFQPNIVLSFGLNYGSDTIRIERLAINVDHARAADNAGELRSDHLIAPDGDAAYWATLPVAPISEALDANGLAWRTSYHAGAYVCNHLLYVALHYCATHNQDTRCGFIHVPPLPEQVTGVEGRTGLELGSLIATTETILAGLCPDSEADRS